jgi:hypothetical protein
MSSKAFVTNLHYVFIYYILDNLIWLLFSTNTDRKVKQTDSLSRSTVTHEIKHVTYNI